MSSDFARSIFEAGIPRQYDPLLLTFYGDDAQTDGHLLIFGDDSGTNLCFNMEAGFIYSVDPKHELPTRFVNSSAKCLATFLRYIPALHRQFTTRAIHTNAENDGRQLVRLLREQFVNIDSKALDEVENWWAVVLEKMEHGRL